MISQTLLNAQDRDALSGWGAIVHLMYDRSDAGMLGKGPDYLLLAMNFTERQTRSLPVN